MQSVTYLRIQIVFKIYNFYLGVLNFTQHVERLS